MCGPSGDRYVYWYSDEIKDNNRDWMPILNPLGEKEDRTYYYFPSGLSHCGRNNNNNNIAMAMVCFNMMPRLVVKCIQTVV